ncbi:MAG: serine protease [Alphaproteobacteria bacterium]|nr:serine protease [Alphaproteobacteria bacterium]
MKYSRAILAALLLIVTAHSAAAADPPTVESVLGAVVLLQSEVPADARTAMSLGRQRYGNGIVIDSDGLIVTIGHVILEADAVTVTTGGGKTVPAHVVAYDHPTGLGLVRADEPLDVRPMAFADSAGAQVGDPVIVAGAGGPETAIQAHIVSRRGFVGYWEYILDDAIFTMPPYNVFGGAAMVDANGRLLGIGSLFVPDAVGPGEHGPGNMFVPVDLLKAILADLIADGRSPQSVRPWLGMITRETHGGLFVARASRDSPAQLAGIRSGSILVGLQGKSIKSQEDFYRRLWASGAPGVTVRLSVIDPKGEPRDVDVVTSDRYDWLRFKPGERR